MLWTMDIEDPGKLFCGIFDVRCSKRWENQIWFFIVLIVSNQQYDYIANYFEVSFGGVPHIYIYITSR